ncbi:EF-hand domain-containing protein [Brevundimonas sp. GCM10030266]|uniref:EF-hand domain-containing protein n=1 Tax=Brevundimonas sp. GCM10030266 TaxID=3273386 RepID=UPI0036192CFF
MSRTLLIGGFAVVALAAAAGVATARPPVAQQAQRPAPAPVSRADYVEHRVERLVAADANRDGTVTREERRAHVRAARQEQAATRFDRLDADRDGRLSREEFVAGAGQGRPERVRREHGPRGERSMRGGDRGPVVIADARARADQAFTRLDTDSDGFLSAQERRAGREAMREQRRDRMNRRAASQQTSPPAPASE